MKLKCINRVRHTNQKNWVVPILLISTCILIIMVLYNLFIIHTPQEKFVQIKMYDTTQKICKDRYLNLDQTNNYTIEFINSIKENKNYLMLLMINERLITFYSNNKVLDSYLFKNKLYRSIKIPLRLININEGIQNGVLMFVANPYDTDLNDEFKIRGKIYTSRFSITKGKDFKKERTYQNIEKYKYFSQSSYGQLTVFKEKPFNKEKVNVILVSKIRNLNKLRYYINIENNSLYDNEYALVALKNWKVTEINKKDILYFKLNVGEKVCMPVDIFIDKKDTHKYLMFLLIENPSALMDSASIKKYNSTNYDVSVLNTQRILLE